jgi:hypothetical protein
MAHQAHLWARRAHPWAATAARRIHTAACGSTRYSSDPVGHHVRGSGHHSHVEGALPSRVAHTHATVVAGSPRHGPRHPPVPLERGERRHRRGGIRHRGGWICHQGGRICHRGGQRSLEEHQGGRSDCRLRTCRYEGIQGRLARPLAPWRGRRIGRG